MGSTYRILRGRLYRFPEYPEEVALIAQSKQANAEAAALRPVGAEYTEPAHHIDAMGRHAAVRPLFVRTTRVGNPPPVSEGKAWIVTAPGPSLAVGDVLTLQADGSHVGDDALVFRGGQALRACCIELAGVADCVKARVDFLRAGVSAEEPGDRPVLPTTPPSFDDAKRRIRLGSKVGSAMMIDDFVWAHWPLRKYASICVCRGPAAAFGVRERSVQLYQYFRRAYRRRSHRK